ncbi:hypothetical protein FRC07_003488 [Ceratobasidium sp. 392]|nr:hypothetical protein FRC07_003488 [Ceratobasidium sp. 392]
MLSALALALLTTTAGLVSAQGGQTCNSTSPCPASAPCCSEFGYCGSGSHFCLGGCNPLWSNKPTSCEPNPICKDAVYKFPDNSLSNVLSNVTLYEGNASAHDFVLEKGNIFNTNQNGGELVMTLTESNGGTRLSSTRYYVNYHNYTIDWQEDELKWLIDGNVVRTLKKADTLSSSVPGRYEYPTTPARVQLSLWPAGINTSAQGTIDWAGGMIDWNDPDYIAAGQFSAIVSEVTVKCAPMTGVKNSSAMTSYVYSANDSAGVPTVQVTNQSTMLGGAVASIRVGQSFWLGLSMGMLCAVAGVFTTLV